MKLRLIRMSEGPDWTIGRLEDEENRQVCVVAERAWVDLDGNGIGDTAKSRIPPGTYTCRRDKHNKASKDAYECWEVCDVPGRSEIHIHIGNDPRIHSKGCPLVGTAFGMIGTIRDSRKAFEKLMKLTAGLKELTLVVEDVTYPACQEKP